MSYEEDKEREAEEARKWWEENGDKVDPVVDDLIDGENILSLEQLAEEEEKEDND